MALCTKFKARKAQKQAEKLLVAAAKKSGKKAEKLLAAAEKKAARAEKLSNKKQGKGFLVFGLLLAGLAAGGAAFKASRPVEDPWKTPAAA